MSASLQIGPFSLPWGLVILMLAWLLADVLLARWARQRGLSTTPHAWLLPLLALVAARLGFVARYADEYLAQPLSLFNVRDGGWEPWAALAVTVVYVWWLWLRKKAVVQPLAGAAALFAVLWLGGNALVYQFSSSAKALPQLSLVALDAKTHVLDQFKGKPVVINLWASWCTPCVREMPALLEAQKRYPQAQFLWVNQQEAPEVVLKAARGFGLPDGQVLLDPRNSMGEVAGSRALPTTLFYDANGQLQGQRVGELSHASLNDFMQQIVPASASALR
ncbi:TlpA disulfide reductase family protein [Comamonas koreensis]|uniref:TlpA family protein disulfide reductase n=1 Tax=Comamonas koreensis TaxID=160825 RepID=A0AAW4XV72_9BURK|nr:TlpA disulfide reductase family protein [Comamonas koreensis]MCD2165317.1 TlpA family protein disulfide reductase [Comamonas koreensis]